MDELSFRMAAGGAKTAEQTTQQRLKCKLDFNTNQTDEGMTCSWTARETKMRCGGKSRPGRSTGEQEKGRENRQRQSGTHEKK